MPKTDTQPSEVERVEETLGRIGGGHDYQESPSPASRPELGRRRARRRTTFLLVFSRSTPDSLPHWGLYPATERLVASRLRSSVPTSRAVPARGRPQGTGDGAPHPGGEPARGLATNEVAVLQGNRVRLFCPAEAVDEARRFRRNCFGGCSAAFFQHRRNVTLGPKPFDSRFCRWLHSTETKRTGFPPALRPAVSGRDSLPVKRWNEVDQPEGSEPEVRIRPTSENKVVNEAELNEFRKSGFVVTTIDMDNEEVWVRGV